MSTELDRTVAAMQRESAVDEHIAVERVIRAVIQREGAGAGLELRDRRSVRAHLYRDLRRGRGEASFVVTTGDVIAPLLRGAVARAGSSVGPAWSLPAPEAPARVDVADSALSEDLRGSAGAIARELGKAAKNALAITRAEIACCFERTTVRTSRGARNQYDATLIELECFVRPRTGGVADRLRVRARHRSQLDVPGRIAELARRMGDRARAKALKPGRFDVVLTGDAIVCARAQERYGWLQALVVHADSALERRGLTRYRPGQSIFGDSTGDALTIKSDGTIPYGTESRPFGDLGDPVRRWSLVERNVARGLSLPLREAALRSERPNGGVANLRVEPGATSMERLLHPGKRPLVRVVDLAWLHVDPHSGWCSAELGLGYVGKRPVFGGVLRANVFELLATARLSSDKLDRDWYHGPAGIRFEDVELG